MARMKGIERPGLFARLAFWWSRRLLGRVPEPVRITAHHPTILFGVGAYETALGRAKLVDGRVKELACVLAAMEIGCPF